MTLVYFFTVVSCVILILIAGLILTLGIISSRTKERTHEEFIAHVKKRGQQILDERFSEDITRGNIDIKEQYDQRHK